MWHRKFDSIDMWNHITDGMESNSKLAGALAIRSTESEPRGQQDALLLHFDVYLAPQPQSEQVAEQLNNDKAPDNRMRLDRDQHRDRPTAYA